MQLEQSGLIISWMHMAFRSVTEDAGQSLNSDL